METESDLSAFMGRVFGPNFWENQLLNSGCQPSLKNARTKVFY